MALAEQGTGGTAARDDGAVRFLARGGHPRGAARPVAALVAVALALAGCAAGEGLDGAFGAQDTGVASGSAAGVSSSTTGSLVVGSGPNAVEYECPKVTVRSGAASWQVPDRAGGLRYQGNLGQLARECAINGGTMQVKVGVEGRVLLGDKGTPGQVKVPIRIAVVQEGPTPKVITTKFFAVPLDIPAQQNQAGFAVVEDQITFPLPKPEALERYIIYVGYDPQGETKEKPARQSKPKPESRPVAAKPKPKPATETGAPQGDVFGPPPSSSGTSGSGSSGDQFAPPPSNSTFSKQPASPPADAFAPPPR